MLKQETPNPRLAHFLPRISTFLFYAIVLTIIGVSELPPVDTNAFAFAKKQFLLEREDVLPAPGSELAVFKLFLPEKGSVSFIMDFPFHPYGTTIEQLYAAQNYLAPLILNPKPEEPLAIVYCSKGHIANAHMEMKGYFLKTAVSDGKGVAAKKP